MRRLLVFVLFGVCVAFSPPVCLTAARSRVPTRAPPRMAHLPLEQAASSLGSVALPTSLLTSDAFDAIAGFADSPAILLLPIGGGILVASLIILILVKSAG
mgnify:CR=1 FL=1